MTERYARIIIDISHEKVDRTFDYRIPAGLLDEVAVGSLVLIPFGKGNSMRKGYVVGIAAHADYDPDKIKEIAGIVTDGVSAESLLISLAWWLKERYGSTMNQALKTVLPVKQKVKPKEKKVLKSLLDHSQLINALEEAEKKKYKARARLFQALMENPVIPYEIATNQMNLSAATLKPVIEKGYVSLDCEEVYRNPVKTEAKERNKVVLNGEQQTIVDSFCLDYSQSIRKTYVIHGITGSGKTEVYMELIQRVIEDGKQVIVLIPEIALTYQTVLRFYGRFGNRVSIINSRLSAGERYDQFERARNGDIDIMIGPRSALFTPFSRLGLILIDEEHEGAYKSEVSPRYHAREVAEKRASMQGASLVLGSATPSLEAYSKALQGEYRLFRLTERAKKNSRLAAVSVVDLRQELKEGNKSIFSRNLQALIEDRLKKREQAMLFINRRGYANFVSCRSCGEAIRCPHCDVTLTLHNNSRLVCHYCGYSISMPDRCPACSSPYIANFGVGTQKIEQMTKKMFPAARVLRMDLDTTSKKGGHEEILTAFSEGEADILIGTQMIVKGHDFPNVTLVGVLAADLSLNTPDYRSAERTFQLLTQAAGRAGRDSRNGDVVIQTYSPEHYSIVTAANQDYEAFYQQEMAYRRLMKYPPASGLLTVQFSSRKEDCLKEAAALAAGFVAPLAEQEAVQVIGPVDASVYKINDIYRKILYLKQENYDILIKIRDHIDVFSENHWQLFDQVMIQYDFS
ncbi:replication restart helicase PriA [Lacrimispora celerecrescens]|uniref:Replication restart protein PriA n=1 Tax=[Clostridium] celerecrescens 18A TaxID=1286362 RepID=A0A2M8Z3K4_9FIRM|nr:primosomal protein N' [Lacrimispora celerecrescens]PJJ28020.1 replication restart DNA helicase PriA [[Clostridium] celerecrescens 18A]